jgi:hypothetical protein
LAPVRADLEKTVAEASRDGLPSQLIVSKIREGVAKGVPADAIRSAADRLAHGLGDADKFLKAHPKRPPTECMMRVLAEARTAGVELEITAPMLESEASGINLARAIEVLTDLTLRGYSDRRAAAVVKEVLDRDPQSVGKVASGVEAIRLGQTLSRADALETLRRNILTTTTTTGSYEAALSRSLEGADRAGNAAPTSSVSAKGGHGAGNQGGNGAARKSMGVGNVGMGMGMMKMRVDSSGTRR